MARKVSYDQDKVRFLRAEVIENCLLVLSDEPKDKARVKKWSKYKQEMMLRLSARVLPTLNEHTGENGGQIKISFDNSFTKNATPPETA